MESHPQLLSETRNIVHKGCGHTATTKKQALRMERQDYKSFVIPLDDILTSYINMEKFSKEARLVSVATGVGKKKRRKPCHNGQSFPLRYFYAEKLWYP